MHYFVHCAMHCVLFDYVGYHLILIDIIRFTVSNMKKKQPNTHDKSNARKLDLYKTNDTSKMKFESGGLRNHGFITCQLF